MVNYTYYVVYNGVAIVSYVHVVREHMHCAVFETRRRAVPTKPIEQHVYYLTNSAHPILNASAHMTHAQTDARTRNDLSAVRTRMESDVHAGNILIRAPYLAHLNNYFGKMVILIIIALVLF